MRRPAAAPDLGAAHPWVSTLLRALGRTGLTERLREIDPADEMLLHSLSRLDGDLDLAVLDYFSSGASVARVLEQIAAWRFGGLAEVPSMLDVGAGYGRVTRHLISGLDGQGLPAERLTVAEILPEALRFQESTFGVKALRSAPSPSDCRPPLSAERSTALVYAGSLFTHLPRPSFEDWLAALCGAIAEGGLLVFSVHDPALMPPELLAAGLADAGFGFHPASESASLDPHQYGSTWVSPEVVAATLRRSAPDLRGRHVPRGLANYQDLWICARGGSDPAELRLDGGPQGAMELCRLAEGTVELAGWALDRSPGVDVASVSVWLDDEEVVRLDGLYERPDVVARLTALGLPRPGEAAESYLHAGWHARLPLPPALRRGDTLLLVTATSSEGFVVPLFAGSLESALYLTARENHHRKVDEVDLLRARMQAMKKSRFWRLRDRWFAIKRALGLTDQP